MRNNKNIRLLAVHNFLVGFIPFAPVAILYFQRVSGSFVLGMSVFSIAMFSTALFEVPTGVISDRVGRKNTIIFGAVAFLVGYVMYAIGTSYWYLVAGAVMEGIGRAFYSGNNDALLYDTLKEHKREGSYEHYLGKVSSAEHMALAIAALIGGVVAHFSFAIAMWLSVIPKLVNVVVGFYFDEPKHTKKVDANVYAHLADSLRSFIGNKRLVLLSMASVIAFSFGESAFQFRAAFVEQLWPIWAIGILALITNVGASASFYFSGKMIKRWTAKILLIGGKIYGTGISLVAYAIPTVISPLLLATPTIFYGLNTTAKNNLFQKEFSDHQRATMSSINSFFGNIAFGVVSLGLGLLADIAGPARALVVMTMVQLIPLWLYMKFFRMSDD